MKSILFLWILLISHFCVIVRSVRCTKPFDTEFWKFQNMMRTNPTAFIPYLEDMKLRFAGSLYRTVSGLVFATNEGPAAVQNLIDFLRY